MTILPLDPEESRDPAALTAFLERLRAQAEASGQAQLASISVEVDALDPLAVLESIFDAGEKHFYAERPSEGFALAGAEAVVEFAAEGPERFRQCQAFIDGVLAHTVAVGCAGAGFGGPHFFCAFTFEERSGGPFPAASVFVPRWQVGTRGDRTVAVANLLIAGKTAVAPVAERVWRAHGKFRSFEYQVGPPSGERGTRVGSVSAGADDGYLAAVEAALAEIAAGRFEKIVLARRKAVAGERVIHPLRALNGLRQRYADCFSFSVANGRGESFIGASPERLLASRGGRLRTEALAGSSRRGASASEDASVASALLRDDKELREHRLVLESILEELRGLGLDPVAPPRPGVRRFANVQHLHTPIEAQLGRGARLLDVASRLHPTPAVGGWPRGPALARIAEWEGFARGLYAGALGWLDARGDGELLVGLRSALIAGSQATLYAGAGIVAGSDPRRELAETEMKFRALEEALAEP